MKKGRDVLEQTWPPANGRRVAEEAAGGAFAARCEGAPGSTELNAAQQFAASRQPDAVGSVGEFWRSHPED